MPITLEMTVDCGICGEAYWLFEAPVFRLYADGLAVYRTATNNRETAPYRFVELDDSEFEELIRYALDEGGLRGAEPIYRGDSDDAPTTTFALHASWIAEGADVEVRVHPVLGDGTSDANGDPITDLPRRQSLAELEATLTDFDEWLADRATGSRPFIPDGYTAALAGIGEGESDGEWPWAGVQPGDFGTTTYFGPKLAHLSVDEAAATGVGLGGGSLGIRSLGDGRAATILIRPLLPGDARPGAFGLRPDVAATTVESGIRVRSLPEVSDASVKYEPLLDRGDGLYVTDGPVEGSGYQWYEVHAPRTGLTGWVAAASKDGQTWIEPVPLACTLGASPDEGVGKIGHELMHLACYSGVEMSGVYLLAPFDDDGLRCPDTVEFVTQPDWLDMPLACQYRFGPEELDTGGYDLPARGVVHPSIADAPARLLEATPGGVLVEVSGALDHPESRSCQPLGDVVPDPRLIQLKCRLTFVITEMRVAD